MKDARPPCAKCNPTAKGAASLCNTCQSKRLASMEAKEEAAKQVGGTDEPLPDDILVASTATRARPGSNGRRVIRKGNPFS